MNKENVLAVADAIEKHSIPDLGFNMGDWVAHASDEAPDRSGHSCGTVACIAGWAQRLRTGVPLSADSVVWWEPEAEWLGLGGDASDTLFMGDDETNKRLADVTPAEAVRVLRHLAETGEVDWSVA